MVLAINKIMIIAREFTFDSAHKLTWHRGKCKNLHGHTYILQVWIKDKLSKNGVVLDFKELDLIVKKEIIEKLDHKYINKIIKNPTAENMCIWIWDRLKKELKNIYEIRLWENQKSFVVYNGDN